MRVKASSAFLLGSKTNFNGLALAEVFFLGSEIKRNLPLGLNKRLGLIINAASIVIAGAYVSSFISDVFSTVNIGGVVGNAYVNCSS